jgi:hypothetical protein
MARGITEVGRSVGAKACLVNLVKFIATPAFDLYITTIHHRPEKKAGTFTFTALFYFPYLTLLYSPPTQGGSYSVTCSPPGSRQFQVDAAE